MKKPRWMIPFFGLALLLSIVLGATLLVSYPAIWNPMHKHVMEETFIKQGAKGENLEKVFSDAENVSGGLWNEKPYRDIADDLKFRPFNEQEVSHYEDVRELMDLAKVVTMVSAFIALIGFLIVGWRSVVRATFAHFVLVSIICGVWMLINWHSLFKSLHWIIFQDASWKLPSGSYSLGLFPHKVWQFAGGAVLGVSGMIILVAFLLSKKAK